MELAEDNHVGDVEKVHCNECRSETNHKVLAALSYRERIEKYDINCWGSYQILQCAGCESVCFRQATYDDNDFDMDTGAPNERVVVYPEKEDPDLYYASGLGDNDYNIPRIVREVYRETLSAANKGLRTLCGIGIRSVIEAVCLDRGLKKSASLADKIDDLQGKSLLTAEGAEILHSIRTLGNQAVHDLQAPSEAQIRAAMKAIAHLLLGAYVLPVEATVLPKAPARSSAKKTTRAKGTTKKTPKKTGKKK